MVAPIITLVIGGAVAFLAFQTSGIETGMEETAAPAAIESPAGSEPVGEEPAEESEDMEVSE